jgi:hypothetical protein
MESRTFKTGQALKPDEEYWWTVKALGNGKIVAKGDGRFAVLNEEDLAELSREEKQVVAQCPEGSTERLIFLGLLCKGFDLRDDVRATFLKLHEKYPENENFVLYLEKIDPNFKCK